MARAQCRLSERDEILTARAPMLSRVFSRRYMLSAVSHDPHRPRHSTSSCSPAQSSSTSAAPTITPLACASMSNSLRLPGCSCWSEVHAHVALLLCAQVCRPVAAVAMSESPDSTTEAPLEIEINNDVEKDYTLIKVHNVSLSGQHTSGSSASTHATTVAMQCTLIPLLGPKRNSCKQTSPHASHGGMSAACCWIDSSLCDVIVREHSNNTPVEWTHSVVSQHAFDIFALLMRMQVEGRGQGDPLLAALGSSLVQFGINVNSAAQENDDGQVFSVFKVTTKDGKQVPKVRHCSTARLCRKHTNIRMQATASALLQRAQPALACTGAGHSILIPPSIFCQTWRHGATVHLLARTQTLHGVPSALTCPCCAGPMGHCEAPGAGAHRQQPV